MAAKSIIIIGAGITGLAAGCYARMNGYRTQIFEMHSQPGGLCTAWKRGGYTFDGSVHFLLGSQPGELFHQYWKELGVAAGREFVHHEALTRCEGLDGRVFTFYTDPARLREHMLALSPADAKVIEEFSAGLRFFQRYNPPIDMIPELMGVRDGLKMLFQMIPTAGTMQKWSSVSIGTFAARFTDPLIRESFVETLRPEFPMILLLMSLVWHARKNAGYPIGGSLPIAQAVEQRYLKLGGKLRYHARVDRIITSGGRAVGVRLASGEEVRADIVVSAADGHDTLFNMLDRRYLDPKTLAVYQHFPVNPSILYISLGVKRTFDEPSTVAGTILSLDPPVEIGGQARHHLPVRAAGFDPTLAPPGSTVLTVSLWADYAYWKALKDGSEAAYEAEKEAAAQKAIAVLDRRWPGLAQQVEVVDVATPLTFERYTGNWQGSTQGWLSTTRTALVQMQKTLPGLENFYLIGQWTAPGGGLPTAARSARALVRILCKKDGVPFKTTEA